MADLDELRIRINADSGNAQRSINALITRLGALSTALNGINVSGLDNLSRSVATLNTAMNGVNGNTLDPKIFTQLARNINRLGRIDSARLQALGTSVTTMTASLQNLNGIDVTGTSEQISNLARAISRFGGANATNAINNIPLLANALQQMMISLSNAPYVSDNIVSLANSMATLASNSRNVQNATTGMATSFNTVGHAARNVRPHIRGLASAFGRFYASCFLAIRAVKGLWGAIGKSMNYIEVLNYFNAAMEQVVANADLSKWEELGYESAEAYAESFGKSILELSEKMTGYTQDATGKLIQMQGAKSLGINATDLLGASTNFLQIASSMGVASTNAEKLSVVLTELGADIASVKNQDFTTVWQKLQSGLVGMSRSVDQYGINIRNANLQAELASIGITTSISQFGQQEKALLRVIVMLQNTEFAYGDLADTIKQPANQVRILKAAFENYCRSLGSVFLPLVAKVIPYITILTNALIRLNQYIVSLLGNTDFDWGASSSVSELVSDALDAEDALDGATDSANKLKKALQGFDELNNLSSNNATEGAGFVSQADLDKLQTAFDEAVAKYQQRWDEALANMSESYNSFADDIADAFNRGGAYEVGKTLASKIISGLSDIKWEDIKEGVSTFFTNVAGFINGFVNPELFSEVSKTVAEALNTTILALFTLGDETDFGNIGESISSAINTFFEEFDWKNLADTIDVWVKGLGTAIKTAVANLDWKTIFGGIGEFIGSIDIDTLEVVIKALSLYASSQVLSGAMNGLIQGLASNAYIRRLSITVAAVVVAWEVGSEIGNQIGIFLSDYFEDTESKDLYINFHFTGEDGFFDTWFDDANFGDWFYNSFIGSLNEIRDKLDSGDATDLEAVTGFFMLSPIEGIARLIGNFWDDNIQPIFDEWSDNISNWWDSLPDILKMSPLEGTITLIKDFWSDNIKPTLDEWDENISIWWGGVFSNISGFFTDIKNALWGSNSIWMSIMYWWSDTVKPFFKDAGSTLWNIIKGVLNDLIDGIENFCNKVIDGIDALIGQIVGAVQIDFPDWFNNHGVPDLTLGAGTPIHIKLNRLAEGGIVTSSTIANIGEAGKEAVIPLERNTEWMDMLAQRLVASMGNNGDGGSYTFVAELDGNTLFEETVRRNDMWRASTGRNAFA